VTRSSNKKKYGTRWIAGRQLISSVTLGQREIFFYQALVIPGKGGNSSRHLSKGRAH